MITGSRRSGRVPAKRRFWTGLPPQSTSTASSRPTKTRDVVSRRRDGTAPEVPRKAKYTGPSGGGPGALEHQRHADDSHGHAQQAHHLGHAQRAQHEGIRADGLGEEAPCGVQPQIGHEARPRRPRQAGAAGPAGEAEHGPGPDRAEEPPRPARPPPPGPPPMSPPWMASPPSQTAKILAGNWL